MTRATLLHVLDRPTALGPAEVRELEQLALAFPYCQTAHLLLAKAAHDQGTMLAGQRLRRAATYAADRTLLRRLIEQVEPAIIAAPAEPILEAEPAFVADEETPVVTALAAAAAPVETAPLPPVAIAIPAKFRPAAIASIGTTQAEVALPEAIPALESAAAPILPTEPALTAVLPAAVPEPVLPTTVVEIATNPELLAVKTSAPAEPVVTTEAEAEIPQLVDALPAIDAAPEAVASSPEASLPALVDVEGIEIAAATPLAEPAAPIEAEPAIATQPEAVVAELEIEEDLPAQAPAIRPPVEVGEARFEFGLAETPAPAAPAYELPGLIDEWAAAAVTLSMGSPAVLGTPALAAVPVAPVFTPAAFTGDAAVGYAFGESSRLGFSMQLLDLLTAKAEASEIATAVVAAAQPPAVPLPPVGTFFEPDLLLLDHWTTHCPPLPVLPSSLDLINNFLKRQPRLTRPGMLPPSPAVQADLSVRSTRPEPDLASETLARILVRQGKPLRAIEIYEKLMVKQPEKMAYFALQIQSLQPPA